MAHQVTNEAALNGLNWLNLIARVFGKNKSMSKKQAVIFIKLNLHSDPAAKLYFKIALLFN